MQSQYVCESSQAKCSIQLHPSCLVVAGDGCVSTGSAHTPALLQLSSIIFTATHSYLNACLTLSLSVAALQYLEKFQGIKFQEPVWFKAGAVILNEPLNYLGQDNLVGARSIIATLAVQVSVSFKSVGTHYYCGTAPF